MTVYLRTQALLLLALVYSASAGVILGQPKVVRLPKHDSAIIQSHRLGGNFAYSTHEAHAYGVETPIVEQKVVQKGVTYHQGEPEVKTHTSYVKQKVPQFGIVRTQHTVPAVKYAAAPVQVATVQHNAIPVHQYASAPVQYAVAPVQYAATPIQYSATPVQYSATQVQYAATPVQYGASPVHYAASPVQYVSSPVHHASGTTQFQYISPTNLFQ